MVLLSLDFGRHNADVHQTPRDQLAPRRSCVLRLAADPLLNINQLPESICQILSLDHPKASQTLLCRVTLSKGLLHRNRF